MVHVVFAIFNGHLRDHAVIMITGRGVLPLQKEGGKIRGGGGRRGSQKALVSFNT